IIRSRRAYLNNGRELQAEGQVRGCRERDVVPLVIESRPELELRERVPRITRILAESTTVVIIAHGAGQGVIGDQVRAVESPLAETDVHGIVTRPSDGFIVANSAKDGHTGRFECSIQGLVEPARRRRADRIPCRVFRHAGCGYVGWIDGDFGIYVDGLSLMKAQHVNVLDFKHRLRVDRPAIATVELFGNRYAIVPVHDAANRLRVQLR